jgi:DNA-binding transcriptional LysR family regulator
VLDPVLLKTFLAVAGARSFTRAAQRLALGQSTVSQHVHKLELVVSQELFLRDTHSVELTAAGRAMVGFATGIIEAIDTATGYFAKHDVRGRIRFGASEDFALSGLPEVLRRFRAGHPAVELELTVDLGDVLREKLAAGLLDLVLSERLPGDFEVSPLWTDELVWAGTETTSVELDGRVPLVAYPPPNTTLDRACDALRRAGLAWEVTCTSTSLNGLRMAVLSGLGVAAFARGLVPPNLCELTALPAPGRVDFVLSGPHSAPEGPAIALAAAIVDASGAVNSALCTR